MFILYVWGKVKFRVRMKFLVTLRVKVKGWLGSALGLGFRLGKLSYRTGGLPPGLGFGLG